MSDVDPRVIIEKLFGEEPVTDEEAVQAQLRMGITPPSWVDAHQLCHDFPEVGLPTTIPLDIYIELERGRSAPDTDSPPTIAPKSTP